MKIKECLSVKNLVQLNKAENRFKKTAEPCVSISKVPSIGVIQLTLVILKLLVKVISITIIRHHAEI